MKYHDWPAGGDASLHLHDVYLRVEVYDHSYPSWKWHTSVGHMPSEENTTVSEMQSFNLCGICLCQTLPPQHTSRHELVVTRSRKWVQYFKITWISSCLRLKTCLLFMSQRNQDHHTPSTVVSALWINKGGFYISSKIPVSDQCLCLWGQLTHPVTAPAAQWRPNSHANSSGCFV